MYIKGKLVLTIRICLGILAALCLFAFAVSVAYIGDMFVHYGTDMDTITSAVNFESSVWMIGLSPVVLFVVKLINDAIKEAFFYNSYFEGDLDGIVSFRDLANISGDAEAKVRRKVLLYRMLFMKQFEVQASKDKEQILLASKKILCQCRHCGAEIEKSKIFVNNCPYCDNPDIHVRILSANRFYAVEYAEYAKDKAPKKEDYLQKSHTAKFTMYVIGCGIFAFFALILLFMSIDYLEKVNNAAYLKEALFSGEPGYGSYDMITKEMYSQVVFNITFLFIFLIGIYIFACRARLLTTAQFCAGKFAKAKTAFLKLGSIFSIGREKAVGQDKKMKKVKRAVEFSYLKKCSFEKYKDEMYVTLGRTITRDQCPNCMAPIKEPVYESYECKYCGSKLMGVVVKRG